jgi:hypothetical protein
MAGPWLWPSLGLLMSTADGPAGELAPPVRIEAAGRPIDTEIGHAAPFVADWDSDGDLDLLVGAGDGSVSLFRNIGSTKAPELAAAEMLVPPGENSYGPGAPKGPRRGVRSKSDPSAARVATRSVWAGITRSTSRRFSIRSPHSYPPGRRPSVGFRRSRCLRHAERSHALARGPVDPRGAAFRAELL